MAVLKKLLSDARLCKLIFFIIFLTGAIVTKYIIDTHGREQGETKSILSCQLLRNVLVWFST